MALDTAAVKRIARLARVAVPEEDLPALARELSGILAWVEQLEEVDVAGVAPMTGAVALTLPMRDDAVTDGGIRDRVLANAPDPANGFFTVPKVVE